MSAVNGVFTNKKESQLEKEGLLHQKRLLKLEMENEKLKLLALAQVKKPTPKPKKDTPPDSDLKDKIDELKLSMKQ